MVEPVLEGRKECLSCFRESAYLDPLAVARYFQGRLEYGEAIEILLGLNVRAFKKYGVVRLCEGVKDCGCIAAVGDIASGGEWHCSALSVGVGNGETDNELPRAEALKRQKARRMRA